MPAAFAAMAANEQGKFWEMHDKIFANQQKMNRDQYIAYAKELKLDVAKFTKALDNAKFKPQIEADTAEAGKLGVSGTPAFFVNGQVSVGREALRGIRQGDQRRAEAPEPADSGRGLQRARTRGHSPFFFQSSPDTALMRKRGSVPAT